MISPKTISAIRDRVEIVTIISETVKLARKGRSFLGLCPFHREKSPSFNVNPEKGFFYCFGCKESGNVFDFVMKTEGLTFPEAARRRGPLRRQHSRRALVRAAAARASRSEHRARGARKARPPERRLAGDQG